MSLPGDYVELRREMAGLLKQARHKIHMAAVWARVPAAAYRAAQAVAAASVVYFLARLVARSKEYGLPGWWCLVVLALIGSAVAVGVVLTRAVRRSPGLLDAAQRLDLAVCDHNRIAIALAVLEAGDAAPFACAAVADGMEHLRRLGDASPAVPAGAWKRRQIGYLLGLLCLMVMLAALVTEQRVPAAFARKVPPATPVAAPRTAASASDDTQPPVVSPQASPPRPSAAGTRDKQAVAARHEPGGSPRNERAAGRAGGRSRGESGQSSQSMDALRDAGESAANSKYTERTQAKATRPRRSADTPRSPPKDADQPEENAAINPGAAGGGAMSTARNEWSQKIENAQSDRDDEDTDADTEDAPESSAQRGGIQPLLKDRRASPSRDLGITGDEGDPGNGRGGPSPPKKSRGTASLVLGVPVPDFVRGRMGPGMTRITHERIEPSPMPGEPAKASPASPRSLPEGLCPRFDVPSDVAALVREYLISLHSADRKSSQETGPAAR